MAAFLLSGTRRGPDNPPMIRRLFLASLMAVLLGLISTLRPAVAQEALTVNDKTLSTYISDQRQLVATDGPMASLLGMREKEAVVVKAAGAGPRHYWSVFSFKNSSDKPLNFVMSFQPQNFSGAGLLKPTMTVQDVLSVANLHDGSALNVIDAGALQYTYVAVAPDAVTSVGVETDGPAIRAILWRAADFGSANAGPLFLTGLMQGMAVLSLVGLFGLYTFNPQRVTLAGVLFGCSLLLFVEGDLGLFGMPLAGGRISADTLRAGTETLMAGSLMLCVISFHGALIRRRGAFLAFGGAILAAGLANLAYSLVEPMNASAAARVVFVAAVIAGGLLSTQMRRRKGRLGFAWLFWPVLTLWTALAIYIAGWGNAILNGHLWMAAATLLLLLVLALVLIRHVTDSRRNETPALFRTELRSLALAAGQHIMFEWMPARGRLHVGHELPRRLNLDPAAWDGDARRHFHAVLHPFDLASYQSLAERSDFKPGEAVSIELRMRGQDGVYHWFELQARAVRGANQGATRLIGTLTDIDRLKSATEQLATDSVQDAITGLPNKALFMDRLERVLGQLGGLPFRVIMLDIDRFKALNEGLGQEAGDKILKTVADRISGLLEPDESLARLNGGQFVLHCTESLARGDFASFLAGLEETVAAPIKHGSQEVVISASTGVSDSGSHGMAAQDLLDQSMVAMLEARKEGGARTVFYRADLTDDRAKLFSLESDLRRALARNEIEIHYQPIVDLLTLQVRGFEALARWRHGTLGLLPPADFMDIAETSGLMAEITQFMLAGAARQLGIWHRVHVRGQPFFVSVNVSASQIIDPQFVARVQQVLEREQPEPGSLKIEITETVIMRQPERSAKVLRQLRSLGLGLACDDFGTGFSSLASLRDLPFDMLKIDRSFIAGGDFEERNAKIIGSITALAAGLGMGVVAEGIETQAQIDALAALGCTLGQGYLLGMPENAEAATLLLSRPVLSVVPPVEEAEPEIEEPVVEEEEPISVLAMPSDVPAAPEVEAVTEAEVLPPVIEVKDELEAVVQPEPETPKPVRKRKPRKKKVEQTA
ncbi:putative bifunctional diguanylate cyclase/phosphodiesterase [Aestuariivirga litoralis]|uniref:putative bifunctional diguanylate cyclase/phosphodiesterase n=1 Tax=Aestuariivirga litoralis TaxID=2650924 RepID=UPI0018C6B4FE|nr:GGDEF and EAL domain-containing protein [Aestuariivirga litoralis]MBG1233414.1 EAL domain-containing protein [Aestuariivirga litoralis]